MSLNIGTGITIGPGISFSQSTGSGGSGGGGGGGGPVSPVGVFEVVGNTQFTLPTGVTQTTSYTKYGTSSISFDGTSAAYLTLTNSAWLSYATTTIEFWAYLPSAVSIYTQSGAFALINTSTSQTMASNRAFGPYYTDTTATGVNGYGSNGNNATTGNLGAWNHVAFVISQTSVTNYLNGVLQLTDTYATTPLDFRQSPYNKLEIGAWDRFSFWRFTGYMDDIRFSSGARYTSTFTPPAARLTSDRTTLALIQSL